MRKPFRNILFCVIKVKRELTHNKRYRKKFGKKSLPHIYITVEKGHLMMSILSKREYLSSIKIRYQTSPKGVKTMILNEFCRVCEYDRKYAIRLLQGKSQCLSNHIKATRGRPTTYHHPEILAFLKRLWIASNLACGKRLKVMMSLWLPFDDTGISQTNQKLLLRISAATINRLLTPLRSRYTKTSFRVQQGRSEHQ